MQKEEPKPAPRRLAAAVAAAVLGAWLAAGPSPSLRLLPEARAALPSGTPVFSNPLLVDNAYHPVEPGMLRVYGGRDGREPVITVVRHTAETRDFTWNAQPVPCRAVRDSAFIRGRLFETSIAWYAQADDGSVYAFGEISSGILIPDAEPGDFDPPSSWVVGAVGPGDPVETVSIPNPTLFMPANPQAGDLWIAKDVPGDETETVEVVRIETSLRVPGGLIPTPLRVLVRSSVETGAETKWYGIGKGEVQARSKGERYRLLASGLGTQ